MRIGVVGSGKVGRALGAWLAQVGHEVVFGSRDPADHAREAAEAAGHGARALKLSELVASSELVLLTLPFAEVERALTPVRAALAGKVLVDVTNPITEDHRALTIGHDDSGAETIARAFPEAQVVKAFNATFAEVYQAQTCALHGTQLSIFAAGDDAGARGRVLELVRSLGFDAVDAGPLRNARYLEPLSLLNIHLGKELGLGTMIGFAHAREQPSGHPAAVP